MDPFFLRCETCQARLRVRDERFVGQVQSCPKCGSMVQILAPAGWLAAGEATPTPDPVEIAAVAAPTMMARFVSLLREPAVLWSTGAATAVAASGLVAFLVFRGGEQEVVALPPTTSTVAAKVAEPSEDVKQELPTTVAVKKKPQKVDLAPPAPVAPPAQERTDTEVVVAEQKPPAVIRERPRTLTLDLVEIEPRAAHVTASAADLLDYPPAVEVEEADEIDAKPQAPQRPVRVTNVTDQLSVPLESIDLPAMPIGRFVKLISGMAAVPIQLDAKVLGEVGLSTHSTVTVRDESTTVGKLLARVLQEHRLTCVERDGTLVVVRAKR